MMKIVKFYRGEIPNNMGLHFKDFLELYKFDQMESDHAWIQWVLPTKQLSNFNDAPLVTNEEIALFKSDVELGENFSKVVNKMLDYFGMEIIENVVVWQTKKHARWWLKKFNHNMLRMDRFIVSMRYFGKDETAQQILGLLEEYKDVYKNSYHNYWLVSAFAELPT